MLDSRRVNPRDKIIMFGGEIILDGQISILDD